MSEHALVDHSAHQTPDTTPHTAQSIAENETGTLEYSGGHLPADLGHTAPDDLNRPAFISDPQRRSQAILQLQRRYGNAYVQRMLAQTPTNQTTTSQTNAVQRYNPTTSNVSTGAKHTYKTPKKEWTVNKAIPKVPVTLSTITTLAEISYETESATPAAGSPTAARGGATINPQGIGVQGEIGNKWAEWETSSVGKVGIGTKLGGEVGTHGGEISLEAIGLEFERATFALKFNLISYSTEESKVEFPSLVFQVGVIPFKGDGKMADGTAYKYEIKPVLEFKFEPNYAEIGKWIAQRYGQAALAEMGLASGIILAGFATIAAGVVTASLGGEVRERVELAIKYTNEFCNAYEAAVREAKSGAVGSSQWAAAGADAGMKFLDQTKDKVPPEAMKEAAKKRNLRGDAFDLCYPQIKESLLQNYKDEHYVEWWVYGERGPGYKILKRLLDEPEHLIF